MCKICKRLQADILKFHRGEKTALQEEVAALTTWEGHADECEVAKQAKKRAAAFLQKHNASRCCGPAPTRARSICTRIVTLPSPLFTALLCAHSVYSSTAVAVHSLCT